MELMTLVAVWMDGCGEEIISASTDKKDNYSVTLQLLGHLTKCKFEEFEVTTLCLEELYSRSNTVCSLLLWLDF